MKQDLKQTCQDILDVAEKAAPRPWTEDTHLVISNDDQNILDVVAGEGSEQITDFVLTVANNAEKLARAVLILLEAAEEWGGEDALDITKQALIQAERGIK